jgi:hypothetical protein
MKIQADLLCTKKGAKLRDKCKKKYNAQLLQ